MVTTHTAETRTLELSSQDWRLVKIAIFNEMKRWPPEHVFHFRYLVMLKLVSNVCPVNPVYKTIARRRS